MEEQLDSTDKEQVKCCDNCSYIRKMVGIGQGFQCTNHDKIEEEGIEGNKWFLIPGRKYLCGFYKI